MKNIIIVLLINLISGFCVGQVDLQNGLVAYLPFNENALDVSGNNYHGQVNSATMTQDCLGNENSAYYFDGIDDYIEISHSPELDFDNEETFSISFLFRAEDVVSGEASADLISKWNSAHLDTAYSYGIRLMSHLSSDPGQLSAARYDGDNLGCLNSVMSLRSEENYLDNHWHHLVFQLNSDNFLEMYVDGILVNSAQDETSCSIISQSNIIVGNRSLVSSSRPYKGALDEIRIYNRALNIEEIVYINENKLALSSIDLPLMNVQISPNPVENVLTISNDTDVPISESKLYDINGKLIDVFYSEEYEILNASGVYILCVNFSNGRTKSFRIIKS